MNPAQIVRGGRLGYLVLALLAGSALAAQEPCCFDLGDTGDFQLGLGLTTKF